MKNIKDYGVCLCSGLDIDNFVDDVCGAFQKEIEISFSMDGISFFDPNGEDIDAETVASYLSDFYGTKVRYFIYDVTTLPSGVWIMFEEE